MPNGTYERIKKFYDTLPLNGLLLKKLWASLEPQGAPVGWDLLMHLVRKVTNPREESRATWYT